MIPLIGGVGGLYYIPWTGGTVITLITLDKILWGKGLDVADVEGGMAYMY